MHKGGVKKLETGIQILEFFQGADLILLTETWHFPCQRLPHVKGFDSLVVARTMQLGKTKAIKHNGGVVTYVFSHLSPKLSQWKEGSHDSYLWLWVSRDAAPNLFICMVYATLVGSKHEGESLFQNLAADIVKVQILKGTILVGGDFNALIASLLDTIDTSDLCELLQMLELTETKQPSAVAKRETAILLLVAGAASSWTYVVMLGCSSSMAGHLVTNQGSSLAWQMGGIALLIILLTHLQFGKLLHTSR
jgi:hypothetical protein